MMQRVSFGQLKINKQYIQRACPVRDKISIEKKFYFNY
jgi:hypothetical protein